MKLIIKEYLASLKEREELDAILPDLLSQLGLNVYSKPSRGSTQYGVDIAAFGCLNNDAESVYLISIKAGDLSRKDWNSGEQSLKPSLDQIINVYIPHHLPNKYKEKRIVVCPCFGGEVKQELTLEFKSTLDKYEADNSNIKFEVWNGDLLAEKILSNFLCEELLPNKHFQSQLRRSIALVNEPQVSYEHFKNLVRSLTSLNSNDLERIRAIRQLNICLWILYVWARGDGNMESAYLSSEFTLLYAWEMIKNECKKKKNTEAMRATFRSILDVYLQISYQYFAEKILPHVEKRHAISSAIRPYHKIDVNLKLFDIIGRLAIRGIWAYWQIAGIDDKDEQSKQSLTSEIVNLTNGLKKLIVNNPVLFFPYIEDQAIDISLALLFLSLDIRNYNYMKFWLNEIIQNAVFAYETHGNYPCIIRSYSSLLAHPKQKSDKYRQEITSASIFYPIIAMWAVIIGDVDLYEKIKFAKQKYFEHCDFQFWNPDEVSENHLYFNNALHGTTVSSPDIENKLAAEWLSQVFDECHMLPYYNTLSVVQANLWPIVLIACRHYRYPLPIHVIKRFKNNQEF